jgi:hypothetical protein
VFSAVSARIQWRDKVNAVRIRAVARSSPNRSAPPATKAA